MPRLVRRRPMLAVVKDYLDPGDWLLWASEELETREWAGKEYGTPIALVFHVFLILARANSGGGSSSGDDVFGDVDYGRGGGWTVS